MPAMIAWLMKYVAVLPLRYPKAVVAVCGVITILACAFLPNLHVSTDRNLLSGTDNPQFKRREEVNDLFGTSLVAVAIIKGTDNRAEVLKAADEVAAELKKHPKVIEDVFFKADLSFFEGHALLFLPVENSTLLPAALEQSSEAMDVVSFADDLPSLVVGLSELFGTIQSPEDADPEQTAKVLGFFNDLFDELGTWFATPDQTQLKLPDKLWEEAPALSSRPGYGGYLTDADGKNPPLAVLFVQPTDSSQAMEVVEPLQISFARKQLKF